MYHLNVDSLSHLFWRGQRALLVQGRTLPRGDPDRRAIGRRLTQRRQWWDEFADCRLPAATLRARLLLGCRIPDPLDAALDAADGEIDLG